MGELSAWDFYKSVSETLSIDFKQSWPTGGGFWKPGEVFSNRQVRAVIIWQVLLIHFSPFQAHAWVTMFCTCITQPQSTHTTLFTAQVTKGLVICKLQVSIRQIALKRMRAGYCFNKLQYIRKSSNAHNIRTLIFAVLSYVTSNGFVLKVPSVLHVPMYLCQAGPWRWVFLQSKASPVFPTYTSVAAMERYHLLSASQPSSDQDEGLCHPQKIHRNTSAMR